VYPIDMEIENPLWDFREAEICNNNRFEKTDNKGRGCYVCLGHSITFHGDPTKDHLFYLISPSTHSEYEGKWDFKTDNALNVCSHFEKKE